jgi:hypothetical protein
MLNRSKSHTFLVVRILHYVSRARNCGWPQPPPHTHTRLGRTLPPHARSKLGLAAPPPPGGRSPSSSCSDLAPRGTREAPRTAALAPPSPAWSQRAVGWPQGVGKSCLVPVLTMVAPAPAAGEAHAHRWGPVTAPAPSAAWRREKIRELGIG